MINSAIVRLEELIHAVPVELKQRETSFFTERASGSSSWSRLQILGHLIDSASNNLHRFIRTQYEHVPFIYYNQNDWNAINHYDKANSSDLIDAWTALNKRILEVLRHIDEESLTKTCRVDVNTVMPLREIVYDYIGHMEHHLKQIMG